ncbi:hypothetical protein P7C73_g6428, partial [Tremellales sp. Uapishka_1]
MKPQPAAKRSLLFGTVTATVVGGLAYYRSRQHDVKATTLFDGTTPATIETYPEPVVTISWNRKKTPTEPDDIRVFKSVLLPEKETEAMLHAYEAAGEASTVRWNINELPSNSPMEDTHAVDAIARDSFATFLPRGYDGQSFWEAWFAAKTRDEKHDEVVFISVFDGHCGGAVSKLLGKTLNASLALGYANMRRNETYQSMEDLLIGT